MIEDCLIESIETKILGVDQPEGDGLTEDNPEMGHAMSFVTIGRSLKITPQGAQSIAQYAIRKLWMTGLIKAREEEAFKKATSVSSIRTFQEAKELGLKRYFTGKPCDNGHLSERYTNSSQACVQCSKQSYLNKKEKSNLSGSKNEFPQAS